MQKTTNFNDNTFFLLKQYKIFHLVEYQISNDDPVRKLSEINVNVLLVKLKEFLKNFLCIEIITR